jgi:hypothetical protein
MSKTPNFAEWFNLLARNKMHGPALATAGIAIGLLILTAGLVPWGSGLQQIVKIIGIAHLAASSLLFTAFAALYFYKRL